MSSAMQVISLEVTEKCVELGSWYNKNLKPEECPLHSLTVTLEEANPMKWKKDDFEETPQMELARKDLSQ